MAKKSVSFDLSAETVQKAIETEEEDNKSSKCNNENENENENANEAESTLDFRVIYLVFFSVYMGRTLILPVMTMFARALYYQTEQKALKMTQQTLLSAVFYGTFAIGGISYGPLSNRFGRRPVLLLCLAGMTIGFLLQGLSTNFTMLVICRCFCGLFAAVSGIVQTCVTDLCPPELISKYTSRVGIVYGLVWGLGPGFAVAICELTKVILKPTNETIQYRAGFILGAIINFIAFIIAFFYLKETHPMKRDDNITAGDENNDGESVTMKDKDAFAEVYELLQPDFEKTPEFKSRMKLYMSLCCVVTILYDLTCACHATNYNVLQDKETETGGLQWTAIEFGVVWILWGLAYSSVQLFYIRLQSICGPYIVAMIGGVLKSIGISGLAFVTKLLVNSSSLNTNVPAQMVILAPFSIMVGMGYGLSVTAIQTILSDFAKRNDIRTVPTWLSIWMCSVATGSVLVMVLGVIADSFGHFLPFYICALLNIFAMCTMIWMHFHTRDIHMELTIIEALEVNEKLTEELASRLSSTSMMTILPIPLPSPALHAATPQFQPTHLQRNFANLVPHDTRTPTLSAVSGETIEISRTERESILSIATSCATLNDNHRSISLHQSMSMGSFYVSTPFGLPVNPPARVTGMPHINLADILHNQNDNHQQPQSQQSHEETQSIDN